MTSGTPRPTRAHRYVDKFVFRFGLDESDIQQCVIADRGTDQPALTYNDILADNYVTISRQRGRKTARDRTESVHDIHVDGHPQDPASGAPRGGEGMAAGSGEQSSGEPFPGSPGGRPRRSCRPRRWLEHDAIGNKGEGNGDPAAARQLLRQAGQAGLRAVVLLLLRRQDRGEDRRRTEEGADEGRLHRQDPAGSVGSRPPPRQRRRQVGQVATAPVLDRVPRRLPPPASAAPKP